MVFRWQMGDKNGFKKAVACFGGINDFRKLLKDL